MREYVVLDTNTNSRLVALMDAAGRHHVAHCTAELPPVDGRLHGVESALGFALMLGAKGMVYRLIFSHVNCGERTATEQLHLSRLPVGMPGRPDAAPGQRLATR
jgi:hypothetical protein